MADTSKAPKSNETPLSSTPVPDSRAIVPVTTSNGLAVAALVVGIVAAVTGFFPIWGVLVGVTAIVLGAIALKRKAGKGLAIAGIITGAVGALWSLVITVLFIAGLALAGAGINAGIEEYNNSQNNQMTTPTTEEPAEQSNVPVEYRSALNKATSYANTMNMSKQAVYDQLTSEYGEKFSAEAAQYAIDNVKADWNANALAKAKSYQKTMNMSPAAIRDQLVSPYGEKFTDAEADYAIQHLND